MAAAAAAATAANGDGSSSGSSSSSSRNALIAKFQILLLLRFGCEKVLAVLVVLVVLAVGIHGMHRPDGNGERIGRLLDGSRLGWDGAGGGMDGGAATVVAVAVVVGEFVVLSIGAHQLDTVLVIGAGIQKLAITVVVVVVIVGHLWGVVEYHHLRAALGGVVGGVVGHLWGLLVRGVELLLRVSQHGVEPTERLRELRRRADFTRLHS